MTSLLFAGTLLATIVFITPIGRAQDGDQDRHRDNRDPRIAIGFAIAPVPLDLEHKNRDLVALGSYLVATMGCNDCHSAGPKNQYVSNPFFGQPAQENPATYLGGGRNFGPLIPGSANIISRNLTPDKKSGLPEGGNSLEDFEKILRTGIDMDHLHPTCAPGQVNAGCVPFPFDGALLQIMPWPAFQHLTDHDIHAIYEYLSAVPCIQGNYPGEPADRCK